MVANVVAPPRSSRRTVVPRAARPKTRSSMAGMVALAAARALLHTFAKLPWSRARPFGRSAPTECRTLHSRARSEHEERQYTRCRHSPGAVRGLRGGSGGRAQGQEAFARPEGPGCPLY